MARTRFASKRNASSSGGAAPASRRRLDFGDDSAAPVPTLCALPSEILEQQIIRSLDARALCALGAASRATLQLSRHEGRWRELFAERWEATKLAERASERAGGWRQLYGAKHVREADGDGWHTATENELEAMIDFMLAPAAEGECAALHVIFLVDGSGSVSSDDFAVSKAFVARAAQRLYDTASKVPGCEVKMGLVQFANECRVELGLDEAQGVDEAVEHIDGNMERMSGGTSFLAPLLQAQEMLNEQASPGGNVKRVVAMLTDGCIDTYSLSEAVSRAEHLADSLGGVSMYMCGIGRGVNVHAMHRMLIAGESEKLSDPSSSAATKERAGKLTGGRYLGLRTLEAAY